MSVIRIERLPIQVKNLGKFGFDHLQLVLDQQLGGDTEQENWFVIEGLKGRKVLEVEGTDGITTLSAANGFLSGMDLVFSIGTPTIRGSRILPVAEPLSAWFSLASYAGQLDGEFPYSALGIPGTVVPTSNSSSVIASLLFSIGLDITQFLPAGMRMSPGMTTLLGTRGDDQMSATATFQTIESGRGRDRIQGSTGNDKLYSGLDDDLIKWSRGFNIIHGGQYGTSYKADGTDTLDYSGAGRIVIQPGILPIENVAPDFVASTWSGVLDHIYSIERLEWRADTDILIFREGAGIIEDGQLFSMGDDGGGQGDTVDLSALAAPLMMVPTEDDAQLFVRALASSSPPAEEHGSWLESVEWLIASSGDDRVYLGAGNRGVEGGGGSDLIDARGVTAFTGSGPEGYDVELDGGDGNDTLIANGGRTLLHGGDGADRFIVSRLSGNAGPVEVVVEGADAADRLLLPHNLFNGSGGDFEGSQLMPVLGGLGDYSITGPGIYCGFAWKHEQGNWYDTDETSGIIKFVGDILFNRDGNDLLVHLFGGMAHEETVPIDDAGHTRTYVFNEVDPTTETIVRIKGFSEGQLGIHFYDLGEGVSVDLGDGRSGVHQDGFDAVVDAITNGGTLLEALEAAPAKAKSWAPPDKNEAPTQSEGTAADDTLTVSSSKTAPANVDAGAGNDAVATGDGNDTLDGGTGDDILAGGHGDDSYYVDSSRDVVVEVESGGRDRIYSEVDIVAPVNVEDILLIGSAESAIGSDGDNTLAGNDLGNSLYGAGGADVLAGGLGNDTLSGGSGSDTYVYTVGDGFDTIADEGEAGGIDRIVFNAGVDQGAASLWRVAGRPDDLLLVIEGGAAGRILIRDQDQPAGAIEQIVFSDGSIWDAAGIAARAAAAPLRANEAPLATDDRDWASYESSLVIPAGLLLENDVDLDADPLSIVAVSADGTADVTLDADGSIAFSVPDDYEGSASFSYIVSDGQGGTASATVDIYVALPPGQSLHGGDGEDTLVGGRSGDVLLGHGGNDALYGLAGADQLEGGDGDDRIEGGAGRDTLVGGGGVDVLSGGPGDDVLDGTSEEGEPGVELDTLAGGEGDDVYYAAADVIIEPAGSGHDTVYAFADLELAEGAEIEELVAFGLLTTRLVGNGLPQTLRNDGTGAMLDGGGGDDLLLGWGGSDRLVGGAGNDRLYGLDGDDILSGGEDQDQLDAGPGNDRLAGEGGDDLLLGGDGDDALSGDEGADTLLGGAGLDRLEGGAGADLLDGGDGADELLGGEGADELRGGADRDRLEGEAGNDRLFGDDGADTLSGGAGADTLQGGNLDDWIEGGPGDDLLYGQDGNDTLLGDNGADLMLGGLGDDWLGGGGGDDQLVGGEGLDILLGGDGQDRLEGGAAADLLMGDAGNDLLLGQDGEDVLEGGDGNDELQGGSGADVLIGGAGDDLLIGGIGADRFVFSGNFGHDAIRGFATGDVIDLSTFAISYGDLHFTPTTGGLEITSTAFAEGGTILLAGIQTPLGPGRLVL